MTSLTKELKRIPKIKEISEKFYDARKLIIPRLEPTKHKGQYGKIAVIGGCIDYTGAPFFAASGALRTGADLSFLVTTREAAHPIKSYSPDLIVLPKLENSESLEEKTKKYPSRNPNEILEESADRIVKRLVRMDAIVMGCGFGEEDEVSSDFFLILLKKIKTLNIPLILDADSIRILSKRDSWDILHKFPDCVITPNVYEFSFIKNSTTKFPINKEKASIQGLREEIHQELQSLPDSVKQLMKDIEEVACRLDGPTILVKGEMDLIVNKDSTFLSFYMKKSKDKESDENFCFKRSGGQGDILCGALATFVCWGYKSIGTDEIKKFCEEMKIPDEKSAAIIIATYNACLLTKFCAQRACLTHFRGVTASDVLGEIPKVFNESFEVP